MPHVAHDEYVGVPEQVPCVEHPAQLQPEVAPQVVHVAKVGVPTQALPVLKMWGGAARLSEVAQQIRFAPVEQSLSVEQAFGQLAEQMPPQQSSPVSAQSLEVVHAFGQAAYVGLRQRPGALTLESTAWTVVQHTSPCAILQSWLDEQVFGHSVAGRQMG